MLPKWFPWNNFVYLLIPPLTGEGIWDWLWTAASKQLVPSANRNQIFCSGLAVPALWLTGEGLHRHQPPCARLDLALFLPKMQLEEVVQAFFLTCVMWGLSSVQPGSSWTPSPGVNPISHCQVSLERDCTEGLTLCVGTKLPALGGTCSPESVSCHQPLLIFCVHLQFF